MNLFSYNIPVGPLRVEYQIKNSKFISILFPVETVEDFRRELAIIKNEFPDARHWCWAYLIGAPGNTTLLSMSDDGEPSGTAGKPMLNILSHAEIGDVGVVIVRYSGGIKLGTGGLVRAYSQGVKEVVDRVELVLKEPKEKLSFKVEFSSEPMIRRKLESLCLDDMQVYYGNNVSFQLIIPSRIKEKVQTDLTEWTLGKIKFVKN